MLSTRSATLAAMLLMLLLFGWVVRSQRLKSGAARLPELPTGAGATLKNSFPDE